jgi:predicted DCC family thiol-disulfide oxidoreductase YuxK
MHRSTDIPSWQFRVFFDADCPLCSREISVIRRLDRGRGRVDLVDLSGVDFDAADYGLDQAAIEARIHGMLPDGQIIEGVEVFVHIYTALGWGWLAAPARWPGLRTLLDLAYVWFARNRLRLTGRAPKVCEPAKQTQLPAAIHSGIRSKSG